MNYKIAIFIAIEVAIIFLALAFFAPLGFMKIVVHPNGVNLKLDGDLVATIHRSELHLDFLTPRTYTVELSKPGYESFITTVNVPRFKRITQEFSLEKVYSYQIQTDPEGATVYLDGKQLEKKTPIEIENLKKNTQHYLVLELKGYPSISYSIETDKTPKTLVLSFHGGRSVNFNSIPEGAILKLEDKIVGVTPCRIEGLQAKRYHVELELEGYDLISQNVNLAVNLDKVDFTLRQLHEIAIISDPPGQIVTFDGVNEGKSPLILKRIEGIYQVDVGGQKQKIEVPKQNHLIFKTDANINLQFIAEDGKTFDAMGSRLNFLPKIPNGTYTIVYPFEHGRYVLGKIDFLGKPITVNFYKQSDDGKTRIKTIDGDRMVYVVVKEATQKTRPEFMDLGEGEVILEIDRIEERVGKFDKILIQVGQGAWSTRFTLTKAEILSGVELAVEVIR